MMIIDDDDDDDDDGDDDYDDYYEYAKTTKGNDCDVHTTWYV